MSRKGWILTAILVFVLFVSPFVMLPIWIHTQFVNYRANEMMILASQTANTTISSSSCDVIWVQRQIFNTEQSGAVVWNQARETWVKLTGEYLRYIDRAIYEDSSFSPLVLKSSLSYYSVDEFTHVYVTKQVALNLPKNLCQLFNL